jgi:hypothetical protein
MKIKTILATSLLILATGAIAGDSRSDAEIKKMKLEEARFFAQAIIETKPDRNPRDPETGEPRDPELKNGKCHVMPDGHCLFW